MRKKIMLINDYLTSNTIIQIYLFDFTHFIELGQKKKLCPSFLVQMKTLKFACEIYWPLEIKRSPHITTKNEFHEIEIFVF
jgi:hypothetical protein